MKDRIYAVFIVSVVFGPIAYVIDRLLLEIHNSFAYWIFLMAISAITGILTSDVLINSKAKRRKCFRK